MKMSVENRARLAFALVVLLGAVGGLAWYWTVSSQYTTYQIRTHDAVSGLLADAPVEFHGVEVGKVRSVTLDDYHSVNILLDVRKDAPITAATVATVTSRGLATRGFTGYVYVSLEDSGTDFTPLTVAPGNSLPLIRSAPAQSVSLDTSIRQVNDNVQNLTELMRTVLDKKTIASLKQSLDSLQQVTGMLEENNKKLSAIIANTEQASTQFKPLLDSSNNAVRALQTQVLPEAQEALANLNRLSNSLNSVAAKIERNPSIIVRGTATPPPGPGEGK